MLKRDEESARTAYDSAMQRGGATQLESRLNNTKTAILNFAFPPMKPSSPILLLNLALGFILGCMLAAGASRVKRPCTSTSIWVIESFAGESAAAAFG